MSLPNSPIKINFPVQPKLPQINGSHYSTYGVGGWTEVDSLDDLKLIFSGEGYQTNVNSKIPIQIIIGDGTPYRPTVLILNSDNISSGRRKIGMSVYVRETNKVYQYLIPNYNDKLNSVLSQTSTIVSEYQTTIVSDNPISEEFINLWMSNAIDGLSGNTKDNSNWVIIIDSYGYNKPYSYIQSGDVIAEVSSEPTDNFFMLKNGNNKLLSVNRQNVLTLGLNNFIPDPVVGGVYVNDNGEFFICEEN